MTPSIPSRETVATPTTSQEPTTRPAPTLAFDANFRPEPDGFSFRNYGSRFPEGNLTIVEVQDLFGTIVCASGSGQNCTPIPATQLWIDTMNDYNMTGGHAEGFTTASRRFFEKQLAYSAFQATVTFDINQDVPIMRQIAKDSVMQVTEAVYQARVVGSPREVVDALLKLGDPVNLNIASRTGSGHSLLAYAVEDKGNSIYHIRVYDNHWPGRDLFVKVDYQANTWRYSLAAANPEDDIEAWEGDATTKTLTFIPFPVYDQPVTCPFCESNDSSDTSQSNFIALKGDEGLLQVTDAAGNRIGHYGNEFINEIPGAQLIRLKNGLSTNQEPHLLLPQHVPFTARILAQPEKEIANTSLRAGGPGFTLAVDGVDLAAGQVGEILVSPDDHQVVYNASGPTNPTIKMAIEKNGRSTLVTVADTTLGAGQNLNLTLDPQSDQVFIQKKPGGTAKCPRCLTLNPQSDQVFIRRPGAGPGQEPNTASIIVAVVEPDQKPLLFASPALPLPQDGTAALDITNWDGTGPLAVNLDQNGDGIYEELRTVENAPVAALLSNEHSAQDIIVTMGEAAPYLDEPQTAALLAGLTTLGERDSSRITLTFLGLDGDDLGEVLFGMGNLNLSRKQLVDFMEELNLRHDELAHLIFELNLPQPEVAALIAGLDLLPAEVTFVQSELLSIEAVDALLDDWEFSRQPLTALAGFINRQGMTIRDIGFMLDELDLELVEIINVLLGITPPLSEAELNTIFYELNLTSQERQLVLAEFGIVPESASALLIQTPNPTPLIQTPIPTPLIQTPIPTPEPTTEPTDEPTPSNKSPVAANDTANTNEDTPVDCTHAGGVGQRHRRGGRPAHGYLVGQA
jgi:hypothetical protein